MPKYVIEREIPDVGSLSPAQVTAIAQQSCRVLHDLGSQIQWVQSYVVADKTYCIYIASSIELIRQHAEASGFPANQINEISSVIDPTTAEG